MRREPPSPSVITVPDSVQFKLLSASIDTGFNKEDWEIAAEAVDEWLRRHDPETVSMPATNGYQWKSLFLPDGTFLRTVFGGKNHHCIVENERIIYMGQAVSPSGFVNAVGGMRRNAWRCTWVLLPHTDQWKLADTLRSRQRPPRNRSPVRAIEPAPESPPRTQPPTQASTAPSTSPSTQGTRAAASPPAENVVARGIEEHCTQCGGHDGTRRKQPDNEDPGRHQRAGTTQATPGCRRRADRRTIGQVPISPALRDELLSLPGRIGTSDRQRREPCGRSGVLNRSG